MSKKNTTPTTTPQTPTEASAGSVATVKSGGSGAIKLVLPAYDVSYNGTLVRVTSQTLENDPELLSHMRKVYPECFE